MRCFFIYIILSNCFLLISATAQQIPSTKEFLAKALHNEDRSNLTDSVHALGELIIRNGANQDVCELLESWYFSIPDTVGLLAYYRRLTASDKSSSNARWRLAKLQLETIESSQHNRLSELLEEVLATPGSKPPEFIKDFIKIGRKHYSDEELWQIFSRYFRKQEEKTLIMGLFHYLKGEYALSIPQLKKAQKCYPKDIFLHQAIAYAYDSSRTSPDSMHFHRSEAIRLCRSVGFTYRQVHIQQELAYTLGMVHRNFKSANMLLEESLVIAKSISAFDKIAIGNAYLASIYLKQNDYRNRLSYLKRAIPYGKKSNLNKKLIKWYSFAAKSYMNLDSIPEGFLAFQEAQKLISRVPKESVRTLLIELTRTYLQFDRIELAEASLNELRKYTSLKKHRQRAKFLDLQAGILLKRGKYNESRRLYKEVLQLNEQTRQDSSNKHFRYFSIAEAYFLEDSSAKAIKSYKFAKRNALKTNASEHAIWYDLRVAKVRIKQKRFSDALHIIKRLSSERQWNGDPANSSIFRELYYLQAVALRNLGQLDNARQRYSKAAALFEASHARIGSENIRQSFFEDGKRSYEGTAHIFHLKGKQPDSGEHMDSLLFYLERSRSRVLKDRMSNANVSLLDPSQIGFAIRMQEIGTQLRKKTANFAASEEVVPLEQELDNLEISFMVTEFSKKKKVQKERANVNAHINSNSLQQRAQELDCAVILYSIQDEVAIAYIATPDTTLSIPITAGQNNLKSLVDTLLNQWQGNKEPFQISATPFHAQIAYKLYQLLIHPIEEAVLPDSLPENIVIIPDDVILHLPFQVLLRQQPQKSTYRVDESGEEYARGFLLHRYIFSYLPSTQFLNSQEQQTLSACNPFAMFTDPISRFNTDAADPENLPVDNTTQFWRFGSVPNAAKEATSIMEVAPHANSLVGGAASEPEFYQQLKRSDIIHINTHRFKRNNLENFEGLILAPKQGYDGILQAYEMGWQDSVKTRLLFLNVCETASTTVRTGEGLVGLPREILAAGIPSTIITRWQVYTGYSSHLAADFYHKLLDKGLPPAKALAEAQRNLLLNRKKQIDAQEKPFYYAHPFLWAPYAYYGSPIRYSEKQSFCWSQFLSWKYLIGLVLFLGAIAYFFQRRRKHAVD